LKYLVLLVACLVYSNVPAVEINYARADVENNKYIVELDLIIQASMNNVFSILTDYPSFYQLNDCFIESTLLKHIDATHSKTRLVTESCLLLFCFDAVFVYFIEEIERSQMIAQIDPVMSDFSFGETHISLEKSGNDQTRIHFHTVLQPSFWIPPFIGPWLLKPRMLEEVRETFERVEEFAQRS
jgi:hypothetical protein